MAFCSKCGEEINDEAVICVHCGCATGYVEPKKPKRPVEVDNRKATPIEEIGSFLIPLIGLILFILYLRPKPKAAKGCLFCCIGGFVVSFLLYVSLLMYLGKLR